MPETKYLRIKNGIEIDYGSGITRIISEEFNPSINGTAAEPGSIFIQNPGHVIYIKNGTSDTDWGAIATMEDLATISGGGGSSDFIGLTDTPETYISNIGKYPRVNEEENGIYFDKIQRTHYIEVHKSTDNMSSSSWFDTIGGDQSCGSWSGFNTNKISPIIVPFDSYVKRVIVTLKGADFNWLSSPSNIYFGLDFYTIQYNGSTEHSLFKITLEGEYSGNGFDWTSHYSVIDNIELKTGANYFNSGSIIGVQYRGIDDNPGNIYKLKRPRVKIIFEEV